MEQFIDLEKTGKSSQRWSDRIAPKSMWVYSAIPSIEALLKDNKNLVYKISLKYIGHGLSLQELIQIGNVGIITAAEKFDPLKGVIFSTYAYYWIQKTIQLAIEKETGGISIPTSILLQVRRYYSAKEILTNRLGKEPSLPEVTEFLYPGKQDGDEKNRLQYEQKISAALSAISLLKFGRQDNLELLRHPESSPEEIFIKKQSKHEVVSLMEQISQRERSVIIWKLGMDGFETKSFEEIGKCLSITKQGARKIFISAINKMQKLYKVRENNNGKVI